MQENVGETSFEKEFFAIRILRWTSHSIMRGTGNYQVKSPNLTRYYNAVQKQLGNVDYNFVKNTHVERSQNLEADKLANKAIDEEDSCSDFCWIKLGLKLTF